MSGRRNGALADLAVDNFIEMRDHLLEGLLPGVYLPLYTMVTFTRIPYAEAARRARRQDRIVDVSLFAAAIILIVILTIFPLRLSRADAIVVGPETGPYKLFCSAHY